MKILKYYHLSNEFEIRESDELVILSKHLGGDVRGNYEDEVIFLKVEQGDDGIYAMIHMVSREIGVLDTNI